MPSPALDQANAAFWDELCGSWLARRLGISVPSPESLGRFDHAYLELYPYLLDRVPVGSMQGMKVLEVGLGYGTIGQKIAEVGADYIGLDIALAAVRMMNARLSMHRLPGRGIHGSMLACPLADSSVDCVVSIGCFHHTGDIGRCLDETWRVLKPGGRAYLMVYNLFSYRHWLRWPLATLRAAVDGQVQHTGRSQRRAYDPDIAGNAAPETAFVSRRELRRMMARFSRVDMSLENCAHITFRGHALLPRKALLALLGKKAGLDIYAAATK
jgi:SAM-dependent methyltransferase